MSAEYSHNIAVDRLRPFLSRTLEETLRTLRESWSQRASGFVACTLRDGLCSYTAVVSRGDDRKWLHAERFALEQFRNFYGEPSRNAWLVSTLSPCIQDTKWREGESCTELLARAGVTNIYAGFINEQELRVPDEYGLRGLSVHVTDDARLRKVCGRLVELFAEIKAGTKLQDIKETRRDYVFEGL